MYINIRQLCIPIQKGCIERKWHFTTWTQSRTISTKTVPVYSQAESNSTHPSYPYQTSPINFANYRRFHFKCPDACMWSRLRIKFQRIYILIEFFSSLLSIALQSGRLIKTSGERTLFCLSESRRSNVFASFFWVLSN